MGLLVEEGQEVRRALQCRAGRGRYTDDVAFAGLLLDQLREARREELRREVRRGLDSGPAVQWDATQIKREGRARRGTKTKAAKA